MITTHLIEPEPANTKTALPGAMLHLRRAAVVCLLIPNFLAIRIYGSSADSF